MHVRIYYIQSRVKVVAILCVWVHSLLEHCPLHIVGKKLWFISSASLHSGFASLSLSCSPFSCWGVWTRHRTGFRRKPCNRLPDISLVKGSASFFHVKFQHKPKTSSSTNCLIIKMSRADWRSVATPLLLCTWSCKPFASVTGHPSHFVSLLQAAVIEILPWHKASKSTVEKHSVSRRSHCTSLSCQAASHCGGSFIPVRCRGGV